jgi:hypothetical protein
MKLSYDLSFSSALLVIFCACAALLGQSSVTATEGRPGIYHVRSFDTAELLDNLHVERLAEALATTGLIALQTNHVQVHSQQEQALVRETAMQGLCECVRRTNFSKLEGADAILMTDGHTTRSTLATATVGFSPLPFKTPQLAQQCGDATVEAMNALRDHVAQVSSIFIQALDMLLLRHASTTPKPITLMTNSYGVTYKSVSSIVKAASHFEHFHVYSREQSAHQGVTSNVQDSETKPALQVHTDAGLFLAFVPAQPCDATEAAVDLSFFLQDPADGRLKQAVFPENSIAIMLGAGAEQWLTKPDTISLKATRHAVYMRPGQGRAWYGMSKLPITVYYVRHVVFKNR